MKRRTFLKSAGLVAGGLAATASMPGVAQAQAEIEAQGKRAPTLWNNPSDDRPDILVIIVDQLRFPQGLITQEVMDLVAPDLKELREKSVTFDSRYRGRNDVLPVAVYHVDGTLHTPERDVLDEHPRFVRLPRADAGPGCGLPDLGLYSEWPGFPLQHVLVGQVAQARVYSYPSGTIDSKRGPRV